MRYLFVVLGVKLAAIAFIFGVESLFPGLEIPEISSVVTIGAVALAMTLYSRQVHRKPRAFEFAAFALGVTLIDLILSLITLVWLMIDAELPISGDGLSALLSGGESTISGEEMVSIFAAGIAFASLFTFGLAWGTAWFMTRKLPVSIDTAETFS